MKISLGKKHIYVIIGLLILVIGIFVVNAAVSKTKAWHSANDVLISMQGFEGSLQQAIDGGHFIGLPKSTQPYTQVLDPGHNADKIWVSVDGSEMTLQDAISTIGLCGSSSHSYTGSINPGHFASEIEVLIDSSYISLQDAIDTGEFCCVPETCASLGYNCGIWDDGCGGILDCGICTGWQYQEDADATECVGPWRSTYPCSNAYDGNWNSYTEQGNIYDDCLVYFTYVKPNGATIASKWKIKDYGATIQLTIPTACWNHDTLQFRAFAPEIWTVLPSTGHIWQCWGSSSWIELRRFSDVANLGLFPRFYEEAMNWHLSD